MRAPSNRIRFAIAVAALGFACAWPACAASVRVRVASIEHPFARIDDLDLRLDEADGRREAHLAIGRLALPDAGLAGRLTWQCALAREADAWTCAGPLALQEASAGTLAAQLRMRVLAQRVELELEHAGARATVAIPLAASAPVQAALADVPLEWLQAYLARSWADGRLTGGRLDADIDLADDTVHARFDIARLAFDSRDGRFAGDGLGLAGELSVRTGAATAVEMTGALRGGEVLLGPFHARWPAAPIRFSLDARANRAHGWEVRRFEWDDPGVLALHASAAREAGSAEPWTRLDVEVTRAVLPAATDRYAATWLSALGYAGLELDGTLTARLGLDGRTPERLAVHLEGVDARDPAGRFAIRGLDGAIDWSATGARRGTRLAWDAAEFYRVALAPGALAFASRDGELALAQATEIGVFGGRLVLRQLVLRPRADAGERVGASLALVGIDLARMTTAFGWPAFAGTLGGAVPHVGYAGDVLTLDGGLLLDVFDGTVNVTRMRLERPFGVAPSLSADIAFSAIDLAQLTGTFSFGEITGRLDGRIDALRLIDWKPVAFDASLRGDSGGRISQRAVGSLSAVGGAGIGGGIQGMALKLFDTFGYARLGLDCRLADNVCHMRGIGPAPGNGYTIVEGSGLPRIRVVGFQREVDWPTLVSRLAAATSGEGPEIR